MLIDEEKIIQLIDNFTANDYGEFLLNNATKDFLFIRPSGNPIAVSYTHLTLPTNREV